MTLCLGALVFKHKGTKTQRHPRLLYEHDQLAASAARRMARHLRHPAHVDADRRQKSVLRSSPNRPRSIIWRPTSTKASVILHTWKVIPLRCPMAIAKISSK